MLQLRPNTAINICINFVLKKRMHICKDSAGPAPPGPLTWAFSHQIHQETDTLDTPVVPKTKLKWVTIQGTPGLAPSPSALLRAPTPGSAKAVSGGCGRFSEIPTKVLASCSVDTNKQILRFTWRGGERPRMVHTTLKEKGLPW